MMSQANVVEQLRAALEKSEREKRALMEKLSRAQPYPTPTATAVEASRGNCPVPSSSRPQIANNGRSSSNRMPQSATNDTRPQSTHVSQDQSRPMKRSKTTHATGSSSIAPMMRSRSSVARPGPNPNPFARSAGPIAPPTMQNSLPATVPSTLGDYLHQTQSQYLTNAFAPGASLMDGTSPHGGAGREMGVDEFLRMHDDSMLHTISPINIPPSSLLSPQEPDHYPSSSFPSAYGSLTSGPTIETAPMSRRNSSMNEVSGQFSEMVRIQSQQSAGSYRPSPIAVNPPLLGKRASEDSGVIVMQGGSFSYAYPSSAPMQSPLSQHQHAMEPSLSQSSIQSASSVDVSPHENGSFLTQHLSMERSVSRDSIKSNSSLKFRAKEALARQNYAAKSRHLQPKPAAGVVKQEAADQVNNAKDGKAAIAKTKYERPKHPKVLCNQCNEHPEGFRGEHELRRHTEAKHKSMVKKWICRDPNLYGIPHSETAVKPLKDCKQCSQNKHYGAYYNAAAHLRRTHFKVKARKGAAGKNGHVKVEEEKEKRGGKGGGDWPAMSELKQWMVEVTVPMDQAGALMPDGTESVGAVEPEDFENEFADSHGLPMQMAAEDYGMSTFAGVGEGFGQAINLHGASFQGDLDSQLSDMYRLNNPVFSASSMQGVPISSAGFDYRNAEASTQQSMAASLMSLDSHGYTSPVSSTATITQAGTYMDQLLPSTTLQGSRDDLADLPFDLTFATMEQ
ncbi:uncharacterized protein B0H64DRAFT_218674 [Chaetomium fimeti]|uniref:DUF7896 domain-containing protein n=1 Tax=Chaetomium fimeti TaxID=1854472 RepID=A0AAE0LQ46_9PEZI|nr:hypothetical protein B0H64DRAFT_218674 [Chaetomium fimeti]